MNASHRFHALDATRAFALLLGVGLHSAMSFFLPIPAQDASQSTALAVTFYTIHVFRMGLFFAIAGFFARMLLHRRGTRGFVADRARRIGVPMIAGWLLLAPPTIALVIWGVSRSLPEGLSPDSAAPTGFPLIHLWFLYYLAIFYVLALGLRAGWHVLDAKGALGTRLDTVIRILLASRLAPLVLASSTIAVLLFDANVPLWFGVPTPEYGLTPQLPALAAFGMAFGFGWMLHRQVALLDVLQKQWPTNLALAVAFTATSLAIIGPTPETAQALPLDGESAMRLAYATCYGLAAWHWVLGLIGAAMQFCSGESSARRYLADASYWVYLVHLPIVFGLQVLLMDVPLHWALKFPLIVIATLALTLASYHALVRPTALGELLNGRRFGARKTQRDVPAVGTSEPAALAELTDVIKRYGNTLALDGLNLAVAPGELLAVLGPNGAGKSTAIGLWLGTLQADAGEVRMMGASPNDVHSRLAVGAMLQDVALAPVLNAREHIALASSYYRTPFDIEEAIALSGIEAFANKRYGSLSGGQKRQVQFALAICGNPRLLFLDEPTTGLDLDARQALWQAIRTLRERGCAIVLTTHYLEEAQALADRVAVIARGRLIANGSVAQMRALVSRKRIRCSSELGAETVEAWPGVVEALRVDGLLHVTAIDAESVVRRLLEQDQTLSGLEVAQATLAEAFTELTKEAA